MQEDAAVVAENRPLQTCENVPLGVNLNIMHALVGPTSNPQSKILGASLRYVKTCSNKYFSKVIKFLIVKDFFLFPDFLQCKILA